jgi:hypothetical protein
MKIKTHKYTLVAIGNNKIGVSPSNRFEAVKLGMDILVKNADKIGIEILEIHNSSGEILNRWTKENGYE